MKSRNIISSLFVFFALLNSSQAQLSGTYTIGGTTPSYATLPDAITALQTLGVSGPVIFNIRPGTYTGKADLGNVAGVSAFNTITIKSENDDSTSVIITDTASATGSNFTFHIFGTDYLTIRNLTISRPGTNANSVVLSIGSNSRYLQIRNCIIESNVITGTNVSSSLVYFPLGGTSDSSITFENNIFRGGSHAIYVQGQGVGAPIPIMKINNNEFINQSFRAIMLTFLIAPELKGNNITTLTTNTTYRGILLRRVSGAFKITANKITGIKSGGNPINMDTCGGSLGNEALVANNFFQTQGTGTVRGIYVNNCSYLNFYHNTVNISTVNTTGAAFYINDAGLSSALKVNNNIFVNTGGGITYRVPAGALGSLASSDNNDLYVGPSSINLATLDTSNLTTLAAWQAASLRDSNSVSSDPQFISNVDLHAGSAGVNDLAKFVASVTTDIDGQTRSVTTPDIGADEFTPLTDNIGLTSILLPGSDECGDSITSVAVIVRNFGLDPQTGFSVSADVTGAITQTLTEVYSASLVTNQQDTIVFTQTLNTYSGGSLLIKAYSQLAGDQFLFNDTNSASFIFNGHPDTPTVVSPQQYCSNSLLVTATPDTGAVNAWYDQPVGGNLLFVGDVFSPLVSSDTIFYVESRKASATAACIRITEIEPRGTNFIEVQNLSGFDFDATGWRVVVSLNNVNINSANTVTWPLGFFNAGEVQYRTESSTDNYWQSSLAISTTGRSWVMIIDNNGVIADFISMNYPADSIKNMVTNIGGFTITVGSEWAGKGFTFCPTTTENNQRTGSYDHNDSTDWVCAPVSKGIHNINLSGVFIDCGIGTCPSPRLPVVVNIIGGVSVNLGNDTLIGLPFSLTLDAGPGLPAYLWSTGATTQTIVVTTHGTYWVSVVDSTGNCTFTDSIDVLLNVGVDNNIGDDAFSIYPNPATDKLTIIGQELLLSSATIRITDLEGRLVEFPKLEKSSEEIILDLNTMSEGIYFLQIVSGDRTFVKRFTVIK